VAEIEHDAAIGEGGPVVDFHDGKHGRFAGAFDQLE